MSEKRRKRYTLAVYLLLLALAIILALVGINYLVGPEQSLVLSLSTELAGVVLIFFIVNQLFLLSREDDVLDEIQALKQEASAKFSPLVSEEEGRVRFGFKQRLQGAETVDLLGYALSGLLKDFREPLSEAIHGGTAVRILLVDITSDAGKMMREHSRKPDMATRETKLGHSFVLDVLQRVENDPDKRGTLEFRLTTWIPSCVMIIVNRDRDDGAAYIGISPPSYREPATGRRGLVLTRAEHLHDFQYFVRQFDALWSQDSFSYKESKMSLSENEQ